MKNSSEYAEKIDAQRAMIIEMIEASMALAQELGPHELTKGCNCIACVNKRKRFMFGVTPEDWKYRL